MKTNYSLTVIIFLLVTAIAGSIARSQSADGSETQQVWFTPNIGSLDMLNLFTEPEKWPTARSKIDVFKFYGWSLFSFSGGGLAGPNILPNFVNVDAFSKLQQWGVEIAAEGVALTLGEYDIVDGKEVFLGCKSRGEWIAELVNQNKEVINNVQSHGGVLRYLAMDEPLHKAYPYEENGVRLYPCRHDSIAEIADDFAEFVRQVKSSYPDVLIGDIEPYPVLRMEQLKEWIIALENKGVSLAFLHLDVSMGRVKAYIARGIPIDFAADLKDFESFLNARNIQFGVIYWDGTWDNTQNNYTDKVYCDNTIEFIREVKSAIGEPDHSIFQSWKEYPRQPLTREIPINLPENDSLIYSHTRLINEGLDILRGPATGVSEPPTLLPEKFELFQNYPNPFNPQTTIEYQLPLSGHVVLRIYNVLGEEVRTLVDDNQPAGSYSSIWDGKDGFGKETAGGIYFFQMKVEEFIQTKKLLLLK